MIGALAIAGGLLINSMTKGVPQVLVGIALALALAFATLAFLVRKQVRFSGALRAAYVKEAFLGNVLEAAAANCERAAREGFYLNIAVGLAAVRHPLA